jgi:ferredoxin
MYPFNANDFALVGYILALIGYNEEEAKAEAGRCMSCGLCFECDNCVMYCPQDAVFKVKKDQAQPFYGFLRCALHYQSALRITRYVE